MQNQLATHLRFNPALLFRKYNTVTCRIAQGSSLTQEQFLHYIAKGTGVKDRELLGKYMKKHHFAANIQLQEYSNYNQDSQPVFCPIRRTSCDRQLIRYRSKWRQNMWTRLWKDCTCSCFRYNWPIWQRLGFSRSNFAWIGWS